MKSEVRQMPGSETVTGPRRERKIPFRNLSRENWTNLLLAAVLGFYLFYLAWEVMLGTTCGQLGVDFCDYWSAGRVANEHGYARMYDLQVLYEVEKSIFPAGLDPSFFPVVPFLYLPVFVIPFQVLSVAPPQVALWIWNGVSIVLLSFYLRYFTRRMGSGRLETRWLLMIFASLPVFLNTFAGQVGTWLVVCMGEFLLACRDRRPFKAGLWLAGLLIKPQVLVLLLLILVLHRAFRILAGFAVGGLVLMLASTALVGAQGIIQMLRLWLTYADDQAHIWIEGMMNWRMLGFHLATVVGPSAAYGLALAGMALTLVLVVRAWRLPIDLSARGAPTAVLGILAATTMFTWHSQINTGMILLPAMLLLAQDGRLPRKALDLWIFLPTIAYIVVVFAPGLLETLGLASRDGDRWLFSLFAVSQLAVNAAVFGWAMTKRAQAV